ncbi:U11/U12 small nuclear ribonucleoprotein 25 kDa protein [Myzus persicae]|uniref:U11/U12 small nuclear ribonucleoprotein 25 kDa protein n=1 Tax=Myzus persicae TaxID=13164 RepID=UPI000B932E76|nr:U11/U12 small nuclear ribonucleoprotein 25 kDa protein [Myzus persicae]XP_022163174.1 U11/U12 small nuclear ribonucleoprotein 25 kDa protein [Myzus persicae]
MGEPADSSSSCTLSELADVDVTTISHERLKDFTAEVLNTVLEKDSVLGDLPNNVTLEEVDLQIAIEHGRAITLYLERFDGIVIPIVVQTNGAKVVDLKKSIERKMTLHLKRAGERSTISWRRIWKTYWLSCNGKKIKNNNDFISKYMENNSKLTFVKRFREKNIHDQ